MNIIGLRNESMNARDNELLTERHAERYTSEANAAASLRAAFPGMSFEDQPAVPRDPVADLYGVQSQPAEFAVQQEVVTDEFTQAA